MIARFHVTIAAMAIAGALLSAPFADQPSGAPCNPALEKCG